ncbi:PREDICTED: TBC1 domain family member 5 homolog A-like [Camelina sativa]|uniref:TBC1 domain family member 5 homolog A-like n=1 Tax=Camelina sativa TaxID=90675 RepID=A0ABM0U6Q5_CAMSA|nr:PREDICTED: TBC1 domain family member 5 homolog A-like [Camelina sativa]
MIASLLLTIADYDAPNQFVQDRAAIRITHPPRRDYEIEPQIIGLVKQNQFHGLTTEQPMYHIDLFEEICSTARTNGIPEDYLKCKLFPFFLADKAHRWLKSLPPGLITSWEGCKSAFLNHFYTNSRSNSLRNKLQSFQQGLVKFLYEAWEHFKDYEHNCLHHGFAQGNLLSSFYRGLHPKYQLSLDTASNGYFTSNTVQEGRALIDNLAASSSNTCTDFDRTIRSSNSDAKEIADLNNMMNQLLRNQQRGVKSCETINNGNMEPFQEDSYDQEEEVNYVGAQGYYQNRGYNNNFNNNFRNTSNLSYRSPNVENSQDQNYPQQANRFQGNNFGGNNNNFQPEAQFNNNKPPFQSGPAQAPTSQADAYVDIKMQELLVAFQKQSREINSRMDNIYTELNGKFESISIHVKKLETQVAQTANAVPRQVGVLLGKPEENPKGYCNAISAVPASPTVKPSLWYHSLTLMKMLFA